VTAHLSTKAARAEVATTTTTTTIIIIILLFQFNIFMHMTTWKAKAANKKTKI